MKLSISAYPDPREGDYVCRLNLAGGEQEVDVAAFGQPEFYAQLITRFARLLADFSDSSIETAPLFEVSSGSTGNGTNLSIRVEPGDEFGTANLIISKQTMHGHLYSGRLKFVHVEENLTLHIGVSVFDVNRMGRGLMTASREEFFCFTFHFD